MSDQAALGLSTSIIDPRGKKYRFFLALFSVALQNFSVNFCQHSGVVPMKKSVGYLVISSLLLVSCGSDQQNVEADYSQNSYSGGGADLVDARPAEDVANAAGSSWTAENAINTMSMATDASTAQSAEVDQTTPAFNPPPMSPSNQSQGLSTGEKVAAGVIIATIACMFFCPSSKKQENRSQDTYDDQSARLEEERRKRDAEEFYRLQRQQEIQQEYAN